MTAPEDAVERAALVRLLDPGVAGTWLTPGSARRVIAALEASGEGETAGALNVLRDHALGLIEHVYAGLCPHEDDPDARDPECPVCTALNGVQV